jgi:replicative DNA helicase
LSELNQFANKHQEAVVGHVLVDNEFWEQLESLGVTKEWFSPTLREIYEYLEKHRKTYGRLPGLEEFDEYLKAEDGLRAPARQALVQKCLKSSQAIGLDILRIKLVDWAKSRLIAQRGAEVSKLYTENKHVEAFKAWEEGAVALSAIEASAGAIPDRMESSSVRVTQEYQHRIKDGDKILEFGVPFLDDCCVGIIPNDLIMVGATTGSGKTEFAKIVAKHNAARGYNVMFFALEAEEFEIERRIKFSMLQEMWSEDNPGIRTEEMFGYAEWRLNRYKTELDIPYGKKVEELYQATYEDRLRTYYRVRGDFSVEDLDRVVLRNSKGVDLIILDHIHYVDMDGDNENKEMKLLLQKLRRIAIILGIPVLCIAHLKKGIKTLIPALDDFHGTSDITKIATTCIMLAKCSDFSTAEPMEEIGWPTYLSVSKFRLDGTRMGWVGIGFFNKSRGRYTSKYALGRLNSHMTKWTKHSGTKPFWVDAKKLIIEVADIES